MVNILKLDALGSSLTILWNMIICFLLLRVRWKDQRKTYNMVSFAQSFKMHRAPPLKLANTFSLFVKFTAFILQGETPLSQWGCRATKLHSIVHGLPKKCKRYQPWERGACFNLYLTFSSFMSHLLLIFALCVQLGTTLWMPHRWDCPKCVCHCGQFEPLIEFCLSLWQRAFQLCPLSVQVQP